MDTENKELENTCPSEKMGVSALAGRRMGG